MILKSIFEKKAQSAMELAVFGAILIFVLGVIVRQGLSTGYQQNAEQNYNEDTAGFVRESFQAVDYMTQKDIREGVFPGSTDILYRDYSSTYSNTVSFLGFQSNVAQ